MLHTINTKPSPFYLLYTNDSNEQIIEKKSRKTQVASDMTDNRRKFN